MKSHIWILGLILALGLFLFVSCDEEDEEEAAGTEDLLESFEQADIAVGQWVEYEMPEEGFAYLGLTDKSGEGYWLDAALGESEGEQLILRALIDKGNFEEALGDMRSWYRDPEGESDNLFGDYVEDPQMEDFDAAEMEKELSELLDEIEANLLKLHVQVDEKNAFDVKIGEVVDFSREMLPDLIAMLESFVALESDMMEEMEEEEIEEEADEETAEPTFETLPGEDFVVDGETIATNLVRITQGDSVTEIYYSPMVPFFGLVKVVADGEDVLTLSGFGQQDAESRFTVTELQEFGRREIEGMLEGALAMSAMMGELSAQMEGMEFDFGEMPEGGEYDMGELEAMMEQFEGLEGMEDFEMPSNPGQ